MKNIGIIVAIVVVLGGLLWWAGSATQTPVTTSTGDIVSTNGIHWHPQLTIFVDGEKQEIPANVGLAGGHHPIHTHDEDAADGILHFEFEGVVRTSDLLLGNFFEIWNKDMFSDFGKLERMVVNGEENAEYNTYVVQSEDKIELYYSTSQGEVSTSVE